MDFYDGEMIEKIFNLTHFDYKSSESARDCQK